MYTTILKTGDLVHLTQSFVLARTADGRAPRTIKDYHRVLDPFVAWCATEGLVLAALDRDGVRRYVAGLRERGWAAATVAIHIRNLRAFLRWLHEEKHIEENLAQAIKAPRKTTRVEDLLTHEEICNLLDACRNDRLAQRDRAMILAFLDTGLRIGEMVLLQRDILHLDGNSAWIQIYAPKTETARFVFLGEAATAALREYLDSRQDSDPSLWLGMRGPLTSLGIYRAVRRRSEMAGLDTRRIHPHAFRKFFATHWLAGGGDETRLMKVGGWASPEMLKIYILLSKQQDLATAHQLFGPVDRVLAV